MPLSTTAARSFDSSGHLPVFNGLHSLDFAFWYDRRPLWDVGLIVLMLGGLASTGIGVWLGAGRIRRALARDAARPYQVQA